MTTGSTKLLADRVVTQQDRLPDGMHLAQGFDLRRGGYQWWVTGQNAPAPFSTFRTPAEAVDHALSSKPAA